MAAGATVFHIDPVLEERYRIANWLDAKAYETEKLLLLAAERGDPTLRGTQEWYAKKTRVLLCVLAGMVEKDQMTLTGDKP